MITNSAECANMTVVWSDSVILPVEVNVQYIKSGIADIEKYVEYGYIIKNIRFNDEGDDYFFTERVKALRLEDFQDYFKKAGVTLKAVFGDYKLNKFDENTSERLILIFN